MLKEYGIYSKRCIAEEITFDELDNYCSEIYNFSGNIIISRSDCEHCVSLYKKLKAMADKKHENISIYVLDSSKLSDNQKKSLINEYSISTVPTIVCIDNGIITSIEMGNISDSRLEMLFFEKEI